MNRGAVAFLAACFGGCAGVPAPAPPRPSGATSLRLEWMVGPADPTSRRVDLRVAVDGAERRIALGEEQGSLLPENQSVCGGPQYAREANEVAKITFYEGGAGGYTVRRRVEGSLDIVHWSQDDGACPGDGGEVEACPVEERPVTTLPVPAGRGLAESIRLVDAQGRERPYDCAAGEGR